MVLLIEAVAGWRDPPSVGCLNLAPSPEDTLIRNLTRERDAAIAERDKARAAAADVLEAVEREAEAKQAAAQAYADSMNPVVQQANAVGRALSLAPGQGPRSWMLGSATPALVSG